jgi:hypothetical protein
MASRKKWRIVFRFNNLRHGKTKAMLPPQEMIVEEYGHDPGVAIQRAFSKLRKDNLRNLTVPDAAIFIKSLGVVKNENWLVGDRKTPLDYRADKEDKENLPPE